MNATTAATTISKEKKRTQIPIRHWYKEKGIIRRGVIKLDQVNVDKLLKEFPQKEQQLLHDVSSALATTTSQFEIVKNFVSQLNPSGDIGHWDAIGYIYSEKSNHGKYAQTPTQFDPYGIPLNHLYFPVVVQERNQWFLPCSWADGCQIHHGFFFNQTEHKPISTTISPSTKEEEGGGGGGGEAEDEEPEMKRRRSTEFAENLKILELEMVVKNIAQQRYNKSSPETPLSCTSGLIIGINELNYPPGDPNGKPLKDFLKEEEEEEEEDSNQLRNVWHLSSNNEGICSVLPINKMNKIDCKKIFIAIVVKQSEDQWRLTSEFLVTQIEHPPLKLEQTQKPKHYLNEDLERSISCLLIPDSSTVVSLSGVLPSQTKLLQFAQHKTPLTEMRIFKSSRQRVIRVSFFKEVSSSGFHISPLTVLEIEDHVAIDLPKSTVFIDLPTIMGVDVLVQMATAKDTPIWGSSLIDEQNQSPFVNVACANGEKVQTKITTTERACSCSFTLPNASCTVVCGPSLSALNTFQIK